MRILRALPWVLLLVSFVFALATWSSLPETIPMRLNSRGEVSRLVAKSFWPWFGLPLVALGSHWLMYGVGLLLPKHPALFNHPEKERFLKIPRAFHGPVIAEMRTLLDAASGGVVCTIVLVQFILWRAAVGTPVATATARGLGVAALKAPVILLFLPRSTPAGGEAERAWQAAGDPTTR
jgi:hypothetical protein